MHPNHRVLFGTTGLTTVNGAAGAPSHRESCTVRATSDALGSPVSTGTATSVGPCAAGASATAGPAPINASAPGAYASPVAAVSFSGTWGPSASSSQRRSTRCTRSAPTSSSPAATGGVSSAGHSRKGCPCSPPSPPCEPICSSKACTVPRAGS
ncbi:hypothetical protein SANTM175S_02024 [Streptomyces antimycoticus]